MQSALLFHREALKAVKKVGALREHYAEPTGCSLHLRVINTAFGLMYNYNTVLNNVLKLFNVGELWKTAPSFFPPKKNCIRLCDTGIFSGYPVATLYCFSRHGYFRQRKHHHMHNILVAVMMCRVKLPETESLKSLSFRLTFTSKHCCSGHHCYMIGRTAQCVSYVQLIHYGESGANARDGAAFV